MGIQSLNRKKFERRQTGQSITLKPASHDSISITAKQKAKQRNEVKPAT